MSRRFSAGERKQEFDLRTLRIDTQSGYIPRRELFDSRFQNVESNEIPFSRMCVLRARHARTGIAHAKQRRHALRTSRDSARRSDDERGFADVVSSDSSFGKFDSTSRSVV